MRACVPQLASVMEWGETYVFHVVSREFQLEQPKPSVICQHGVDRRACDSKVRLARNASSSAVTMNVAAFIVLPSFTEAFLPADRVLERGGICVGLCLCTSE